MILRRLLTIAILLTSTIWSQAQQINAVPDYVFRNQMSVGRNAVTDTAAYFSIGPRYGATKGFMPPIVGDTATFSSGKRNGLLIFSVQKNKFLYWDSVRVQWSDMAGSSGAYIVAGDTAAMLAPYLRKADTTAMLSPYLRKADTTTLSNRINLKLNISDTSSMLTPYVRHAGYGLTKSGQSFLVDTLNIATRAWRQKGLDSLAALEVSGSGTTNYVAKFTAASTIGNSQIFDNGASVGIGTVTPSTFAKLEVVGQIRGGSSTTLGFYGARTSDVAGSGVFGGNSFALRNGATSEDINFDIFNRSSSVWTTPVTFKNNGRVLINTTTDAGYQFDVNGTLRSVNGANFATTSGNVGIGTVTPRAKLDVSGDIITDWNDRFIGTQFSDGSLYAFGIKTVTGNRELQLISKSGGAPDGNGITFYTGTTPSEKMRITYLGNVGIGTASPQRKLSVEVPFANTGDVGYLVSGQTGATPLVELTSVVENISTGATAMGFRTLTANAGSATEKMRLTNNAELLINTTTDAGDYKLQVSGNIYNTGSAVLAATSGSVGIGTASPVTKLHISGAGSTSARIQATGASGSALIDFIPATQTNPWYLYVNESRNMIFQDFSSERGRINSAGEWIIDASGTDAGDYKLQVVGNARVGTGKLDIASNTTFGLGVARSGTSEVAGQIYNSNGILYLGAESSAGGQIFSGSAAYAGVIGTGANYPLQFGANNITRATLTTGGNFMIGFPTDTYFYRLQVNGSIFSNNQIIAQNTAAQLNIDSSTNISPLYISNQSLTGSSAQGLFYGNTTWNTTGNPSLIDLAITNTASGSDANYIKISDGSNIFRVTKAAEVVTAAPTGGSIRKWKLGEAATVSPTSPNRTIRVEIDGTVYYLHAKTTND